MSRYSAEKQKNAVLQLMLLNEMIEKILYKTEVYPTQSQEVLFTHTASWKPLHYLYIQRFSRNGTG